MLRSLLFTLKEYFTLIGLLLKVKVTQSIEYMRVVMRYYRQCNFRKIDTALLFSYFLTNPFRISKHFLLSQGEQEIYTYGETPLTTLDGIAQQCDLSAQDVVFELGCGRGRTCFWLNQFIGCTVVGIDYVPSFIEKAQKVQQRFHVSNISFRLENLFQADLTGATVIYLYGTCFSAASIQLLIQRLNSLPVGTKVITVSYALNEFQSSASFQVVKQWTAPFTWGQAEVYLQVKIKGEEKKNLSPP